MSNEKPPGNVPSTSPEPDDESGSGVEGELTPRQEQAIIALLREPTLAQAAKASEVSERTLHRWLANLTFREAYRKARREVYSQALALVHKYSPLAVNTLARTLNDPMAQASVKVAAAVAILKLGRDAIELDDLQERVTLLEKNLDADGKPIKRVYTLEHEDENPI
jgi:hypothetical protein